MSVRPLYPACILGALGLLTLTSLARAEQQGPAIRISGTQVILIRPIQFTTNSDALAPGDEAVLEDLRHLLRSTPSIGRIRVEYHADCSGSREVVAALARQRAERIRTWLVTNGIASSRIETQAVLPWANSTRCQSARGRHVEIWIVS